MLFGSEKESIDVRKRNIWERKLFGISQQVRVALGGMEIRAEEECFLCLEELRKPCLEKAI
jgi:hypothetical protein